MATPELDIAHMLFGHAIDEILLSEFAYTLECVNYGGFEEINWLNTPGPIYTTCTDNCGTGQIEALSNVGGDENYCEVIFKQPFTKQELRETLMAAARDPMGAYYFDGNQNWNDENIAMWWSKSEERIAYVIDNYRNELDLPAQPHINSWKIGGKLFTGQLYGPPRPIPENYKCWLDFYQFKMKEYLEWYILRISGQAVMLPALNFDWTRREELDKIFNYK